MNQCCWRETFPPKPKTEGRICKQGLAGNKDQGVLGLACPHRLYVRQCHSHGSRLVMRLSCCRHGQGRDSEIAAFNPISGVVSAVPGSYCLVDLAFKRTEDSEVYRALRLCRKSPTLTSSNNNDAEDA